MPVHCLRVNDTRVMHAKSLDMINCDVRPSKNTACEAGMLQRLDRHTAYTDTVNKRPSSTTFCQAVNTAINYSRRL